MTITHKTSSTFWWLCVVTGGAIIAYHAYWMNMNDIGARAWPPYAIPMAVLSFMMTIALGAMAGANLAPKGKLIGGICWVILVYLISFFLSVP